MHPGAAAGCTAHTDNHRLSIADRKTGISFLVDSGANVSVIPKSKISGGRQIGCPYKLYAANNTEITTYGTSTVELDFGLQKPIRWTFVVCDVKQPILGADFLRTNKLLIDLYHRRLVDSSSNVSVFGSLVRDTDPIQTIHSTHPYHDILEKYPDITKSVSFREPAKHDVKHHIETTGPPVYARARPLPPERFQKVREEFRVMQELGICRPSNSPWASPLHVVPKKDGNLRACGDYRRLNSVTKPDRYPIPRLQDFTYGMAGKKIFTTLDINRAYHAIEMAPEDIEKTAIITPFGLFEFPRLTFGLRNATQTFQRFMNSILQGEENYVGDEGTKSSLFCYIDDIIIASETEEAHKAHLAKVFEKFQQFGITINLSKCCFGKSTVNFLGYSVSELGIKPLDEKVKAMIDFPKPETVEQLRRFLGMVNFYRAHIKNAAKTQAHLNKFLHNSKKNDQTKIVWDDDANDAFTQSKESLKRAATLSFPAENVPLALMTDASNSMAGAVLQQKIGNVWKPLSYFSKAFSPAQKKYSTFDRELLAIYMAIIHFRYLIEGRELIVYTDHKPLTFALSKVGTANETPKRANRLMFISEFTSEIKHIEGSKNTVADALSRIETITCPTAVDFQELAQAQETDTHLPRSNSSEARFATVAIPSSDKVIYCEVSTNTPRPYVPSSFRRNIFEAIHNISHPGIRATRKMVTQKFFWPSMNKDIGKWARACIDCQKSKVSRHVNSNLGTFQPAGKLEHLHVDLVGPLPTTQQGHRYLVTMIDRFSRWPEAVPIQEMTAETVAKTIYEHWICRFGAPIHITTDQGRQFESELFMSLLKLLGVKRSRTTAYHPESNGMIERWHRSLKAALTARMEENSSWLEELPTVLLGLRAAIKAESEVSAAELMYGQVIRLPGDFYVTSQSSNYLEPSAYVEKLRNTFANIKPIPHRKNNHRKIFVFKELNNCSHVFIRNDMVRKPLTPTYNGPYRVLQRNNKTFKVQLPNRQVEVSIDRLKPAFLVNHNEHETTRQIITANPNIPPSPASIPGTRTTRRGRIIHRPVRYLIDT